MLETLEFIDLYSFDPSTASEFGIPVLNCKGMILLFPFGAIEQQQHDHLETIDSDVKFVRQTIENSCCMMALLHILLNNPSELLNYHQDLPKTIQTLLESTDSSLLEEIVETSAELKEIHEEMAGEGETDQPTDLENVLYHFVAIIPTDNSECAWLLDGMQSGPVKFKNDSLNFFELACKIASEEFVQKSTDQTNFSAVILI